MKQALPSGAGQKTSPIERLPVGGTTGKVQKNTRRELLYGYRETLLALLDNQPCSLPDYGWGETLDALSRTPCGYGVAAG